jgi:hypothetical protein
MKIISHKICDYALILKNEIKHVSCIIINIGIHTIFIKNIRIMKENINNIIILIKDIIIHYRNLYIIPKQIYINVNDFENNYKSIKKLNYTKKLKEKYHMDLYISYYNENLICENENSNEENNIHMHCKSGIISFKKKINVEIIIKVIENDNTLYNKTLWFINYLKFKIVGSNPYFW